VTEAFLHALGAVERKVAPELATEWRKRAEAIRDDLGIAAASAVPSAP
jgi:nicotinamide mononucleotide (NMN) deamidase PncC